MSEAADRPAATLRASLHAALDPAAGAGLSQLNIGLCVAILASVMATFLAASFSEALRAQTDPRGED